MSLCIQLGFEMITKCLASDLAEELTESLVHDLGEDEIIIWDDNCCSGLEWGIYIINPQIKRFIQKEFFLPVCEDLVKEW